ncbi:MAG TPA: rhomboid family intramembrane serine protease [Anaerolineaceae bacterium]|nr:rhomboid family intramembrane serine protease [Anaerolineaceae bacterium]
MLPLRDTIHSKKTPVITWIIILLNAIVFLYEIRLPSTDLSKMINEYGLIPSRLDILTPTTWLPLISHMFLHGGWIHFLSNMWILFVFGDNVEDRLGKARFLLFYLIGGASAGIIQSLFGHSDIPAVGASGAIAAVLGAYFLFFPTARIITLIPILIFPWFVRIPAIIFLGLWFLTQLWSGLISMTMSNEVQMGGVAWWAHIGGFIVGFFMALPALMMTRKKTIYSY